LFPNRFIALIMKIIPSKIVYLNTVDSTNNYAANYVLEHGLLGGTVILAFEQTKGRGQRGANWSSEEGASLTFSVILDTSMVPVTKQFVVSQFVALAIERFLSSFLKKNDVAIKWPNDILVDEQKICGVLIESVAQGSKLSHSIIGIGLNVNQKNFTDLPFATSLLKLAGQDFELDEVLNNLLAHLNAQYIKLLQGKDAEISAAYEEKLFGKKEVRKWRYKDTIVAGEVIGVNENGQLQMQLADYGYVVCNLKEVELVRG